MQTTENVESSPKLSREQLLPNRVTLADIAAAMNGGERAARNHMDRLRVPFVKAMNVRYYDLDDVRAAILNEGAKPAPRGRGRPRKTDSVYQAS